MKIDERIKLLELQVADLETKINIIIIKSKNSNQFQSNINITN